MKTVQLTENEVLGLCNKSRDIFLRQPILLELEAPLKICGECPNRAFLRRHTLASAYSRVLPHSTGLLVIGSRCLCVVHSGIVTVKSS